MLKINKCPDTFERLLLFLKIFLIKYLVTNVTNPLWSFKSIFWPNKSRNSWKAGVICLFPKSCSSVTWPARWWRTPNLNLDTKACSSYRAINVPAPEQTTGISVLTFRDSLIACKKNYVMLHRADRLRSFSFTLGMYIFAIIFSHGIINKPVNIISWNFK